MTSPELERLVEIDLLKKETPLQPELDGLYRSGVSRLDDAERTELSFDSRFDLAYNAAHALALYALRRAGYRTDRRYVVFQALPHTAGLSTGHWRVLAKAHERRNSAEYEGHLERDDQLLEDVIECARTLVEKLPTP